MQLLGGNQVANIQLMQMFPWFGTLEASKSEAALMAKAKYEVFNATKAEVFFQVKASWYQLMKIDKEIDLVTENIELMKSLEKMVLIKFQSPSSESSSSKMTSSGSTMKSASGGSSMNSMGGNPNQPTVKQTSNNTASQGMSSGMSSPKSGLQDVLRVKMEILEQENRLAQLKDQRVTEQVAFNSILNRNLNSSVEINNELSMELLPFDKIIIADSILKNNSMLAMLRNENESYNYMERKAKKMGLPMLGLGLNYMIIQPRAGNTSMMNGNDMVMPMVSVSIPIYRKKYTAMQNEAKFMKAANDQQQVSLKNNLLVQHQQLIQTMDDAGRRVILYKEQENLARKITELLLTDFSSSGSNYEEVLRMQLKVLDYGFKHIEAIVDNNTAVANIEMLLNSIKY
jgi:outer membrane protein TolC